MNIVGCSLASKLKDDGNDHSIETQDLSEDKDQDQGDIDLLVNTKHPNSVLTTQSNSVASSDLRQPTDKTCVPCLGSMAWSILDWIRYHILGNQN